MSSTETRGELVIHIPNYPIQPSDLNIHSLYFGNFQDLRTEQAARLVVAFSTTLGGWEPFTRCQIEIHLRYTHRGFNFQGLVEPLTVWDRHEPKMVDGGYLVKRSIYYYVTTGFVSEIKATQDKDQRLELIAPTNYRANLKLLER